MPCDSITILRGSEGCFVGCITSNCYYGWSPTCKGVGVFSSILFYRIRMSWDLTILYGRLVYQRTVFILPCDSITILRGSEGCFVGCITSNCYYGWSPTCKGVGVFSSILFYRIRMSWDLTILYGRLVYQRTVFILPCDSITILGSIKGCFVGCITSNCHYGRSPASKCVGVFRCIQFYRICMSWDLTILYGRLVYQRTVFILPCDSITILGSIKGCFVGCITSNCHYGRSPTCKGVGVFRCIQFYRICVSRNLSILNNRLVNQRAIFILPGNSITIL